MDLIEAKKHIQKLNRDYDFDKGRTDLRKLYQEVFILLLQTSWDKDKFLWIGFSDKEVFLELLPSTDYQKLHEIHKTDTNLLMGKFLFHSNKNSFSKNPSLHFFVDSWNGFFWGSMDPFKIIEDRLFQKTA